MSDHIVQTIDLLIADVTAKQKEISELQRTVNYLCIKAGIPEKFGHIDVGQAESPPISLSIAPDRYHGMRLNTATTDYLKMRAAVNPNTRAASAEEIYEALNKGGFSFDHASKDERMHSLKTSLGKSTHTFSQVQKGMYGLAEWYGKVDVRPRKARKGAGGDPEGGGDHQETADGGGGGAEEAK